MQSTSWSRGTTLLFGPFTHLGTRCMLLGFLLGSFRWVLIGFGFEIDHHITWEIGSTRFAIFKRLRWRSTLSSGVPYIMRLEGGFIVFLGSLKTLSPSSFGFWTRDSWPYTCGRPLALDLTLSGHFPPRLTPLG
jgi:hypothetical protein